MSELIEPDGNSVEEDEKIFLQRLASLLKDYSAEFYYTNDDDGIHVAIFGDEIFTGELHGDNLSKLRKAINER